VPDTEYGMLISYEDGLNKMKKFFKKFRTLPVDNIKVLFGYDIGNTLDSQSMFRQIKN
jgi:hypothetical protein